jgi:hypothetical protein
MEYHYNTPGMLGALLAVVTCVTFAAVTLETADERHTGADFARAAASGACLASLVGSVVGFLYDRLPRGSQLSCYFQSICASAAPPHTRIAVCWSCPLVLWPFFGPPFFVVLAFLLEGWAVVPTVGVWALAAIALGLALALVTLPLRTFPAASLAEVSDPACICPNPHCALPGWDGSRCAYCDAEAGRCPNSQCGSVRGWNGSKCAHCGTGGEGDPQPHDDQGPAAATAVLPEVQLAPQGHVTAASAFVWGNPERYDGNCLVAKLGCGEVVEAVDQQIQTNEYGKKIVKVRIPSGEIGWVRLDRTDLF